MTEDERRRLSRRTQERLRAHFAADGGSGGIEAACPCPGACLLHGRCAACMAWHRDHARWPLPYCLRTGPGVTCERGEALRNVEPDGDDGA